MNKAWRGGTALADATIDPRLAANPEAIVKMCSALVDSGEAAKAIAIAEAALRADPDAPVLREAVALVLGRSVPAYHLPMLLDEPRNRAYAAAIGRAAGQARLVLDIGTGSGLLAMLAARAGARQVVACEADPLLAATATEIIDRNGFSDRVRVIASHSTALDPERDLGGRADLIVSEVFGHDLVGEGALPALADAVERLAASDAVLIPGSGRVMVALASFAEPAPSPVSEVCGFDLGPMNRHARGHFRLDIDDPALVLRSDAAALFNFNFASGQQPDLAQVQLTSNGGRVNGIVQWLALELDQETSYENRPQAGAGSHWRAVCWTKGGGVEAAPGQTFTAHGWRSGDQLRLWLEG